jgi:hypothetical protein
MDWDSFWQQFWGDALGTLGWFGKLLDGGYNDDSGSQLTSGDDFYSDNPFTGEMDPTTGASNPFNGYTQPQLLNTTPELEDPFSPLVPDDTSQWLADNSDLPRIYTRQINENTTITVIVWSTVSSDAPVSAPVTPPAAQSAPTQAQPSASVPAASSVSFYTPPSVSDYDPSADLGLQPQTYSPAAFVAPASWLTAPPDLPNPSSALQPWLPPDTSIGGVAAIAPDGGNWLTGAPAQRGQSSQFTFLGTLVTPELFPSSPSPGPIGFPSQPGLPVDAPGFGPGSFEYPFVEPTGPPPAELPAADLPASGLGEEILGFAGRVVSGVLVPIVLGALLPGDVSPRRQRIPRTRKDFEALGWQYHHWFPQQFRDEFDELDIDVDDYTTLLPPELHQQLHNNGFGGQQWNEAWDAWLDEALLNGYDANDAVDFLYELLEPYIGDLEAAGIRGPNGLKAIVPYPK